MAAFTYVYHTPPIMGVTELFHYQTLWINLPISKGKDLQ